MIKLQGKTNHIYIASFVELTFCKCIATFVPPFVYLLAVIDSVVVFLETRERERESD
jgi:hypothetical protein